jgi:effector-binding domain-containing protein
MYGNTDITFEDNISETGNPYISEQEWKDLSYTKYDLESFSKFERVSAQTRAAVDSINKIMKSSDTVGIFIRNNNAQYGNINEETNAVNKNGVLTFYHERNFMHFIYVIDKLTDGNISSLISSTYSPNNDRLERKINLNDAKYRGSTVAKAIIYGKKLDEMAKVLANLENLNPSQFNIKNFLSKDLLRKLYSQDQSYFTQINKESNETLEICKLLQFTITVFNEDLEQIEYDIGTGKIVPDYLKIAEFQQWITFLIEFTQTFFNHRLSMIKVVKFIMKTLETRKLKANALKPGEANSRIGRVTIYSDKDFDKLSVNELQKITKNIVNQTIDRYFGVNKLPVYVLTFKDAAKYNIPDIEKRSVVGITHNLQSSNKLKQYVDKIKSFSNSNNIENNEQKIGEVLELYFDKLIQISINNLKPEGALILMDTSVDKIHKSNNAIIDFKYTTLMSLITKSVYYYSCIVHETIHSMQYNDVKNNYKDINNIMQGYYDESNKNKGDDIVDKIRRNKQYRLQSYIFNNMETEAMSEQRNFILLIKRNEVIEERVKSALKSVNFIHDI